MAGAVTAVAAGSDTNSGAAAVSVTPGTASLLAGITASGGGVMPVHSKRPFGRVSHCHGPAACNVVHVADSRANIASRAGKRMLMSMKTGGRTGCVEKSGG